MKDKVLNNMTKRPVLTAGVNLAAGVLLGQYLPPEATNVLVSMFMGMFA